MMNALRRATIGFLLAFPLSALIGPLSASGQEPPKVYRVGMLGYHAFSQERQNAFRGGMRALGYVEGQNLVLEARIAGGRADRLPQLAAELVRLKVDVIVASSTPAIQAAKSATTTIPIVMTGAGDPVGAGLVASLARPGGNITGSSLSVPELSGKRLEILKQIVPHASRIAVLSNPTNPVTRLQLKATEEAARTLRLRIELLEARSVAELEAAFTSAVAKRVDAMNVLGDSLFANNPEQLAGLSLKHRLPAVAFEKSFVVAGGLVSYGIDVADLYRRAARYVDRILKGTRAADLPIEQPTKFELVINHRTAKVFGLTIPQSLLLRADRVFE